MKKLLGLLDMVAQVGLLPCLPPVLLLLTSLAQAPQQQRAAKLVAKLEEEMFVDYQ